MLKKLLAILLISTSFFCLQADDNDTDSMNEMLAQVDLVLFVLQRNTLRMERYSLDQLNNEVNVLSKDISDQHCIFKIRLTSAHSRARFIAWDFERSARLKIIAGKKTVPIMYYLLLEKIIPETVSPEDVSLLLFDCSVEHAKELKAGRRRTVIDWKSNVTVAVPAPDGELLMQLVLDGKVDAACGFFVEHDLFDQGVPIHGKLKIDDALHQGILVKDEPIEEQQLEPEYEIEEGAVQDTSYCSKIKKYFNSAGKLCSDSCSKVIGLFV